MEKKPAKPATYEMTRIGVYLPAVPIPNEGVTRRKITGLKLRDLQTREFRTPLVSIQQAAKETLQLLKKYKVEIDQDVRVVQELLKLNPYFFHLQWVADAAERFDKCQRAKRTRGRPKRRYKLSPEVVVGLVQVLRASGEAKSDRDAANWLEISGIFSSTKVLRKLKQAKKDPRLKPLLFPPPDTWPNYTEEELIHMYETAITPEEGQTLRFELQGDHFQYVGTQNTADRPCADEDNN